MSLDYLTLISSVRLERYNEAISKANSNNAFLHQDVLDSITAPFDKSSMKLEPPIDYQLLLSTLHEAYGIRANRLRFLPVGFVTISYIVECPGQNPERYFLKVWNNSRWGSISAGRLDTYLPLTNQLAAQGLLVPRFLPTLSGERKTRAGDLTLVLYEYLSYPALDALDKPPPDLPVLLGRLTARIHRATLAVDTSGLAREQFDASFAHTLLACLDELEIVSDRHRPGQQALRSLLLPHKAHLLGMLDRLYELGRQASDRHPELVLVHTDLNHSNLLWNPHSDLVVLDWEGSMLAPAEHDLFIFTGDDFLPVLRAYCQAAGPRALHAGSFGFYFYRRNLEDLTDWLVTILRENTRDDQDQVDLAGIQHDCIDGWPWLESGIRRVEQQLRMVNEGQ
jgi:spectinomycin phosphotransferase